MNIGQSISKLRNIAQFSQANFAEIFGVSQQSVQKWEDGSVIPGLDKLIKISKHFDVSLDALILGNTDRIVDEMKNSDLLLEPQYSSMHGWEMYCSNLKIEYRQCIEEGLDIEKYKDVFYSIASLPQGTLKQRFADILFDIICNAPIRQDYEFKEPDSLNEINKLRKPHSYKKCGNISIEDKIHGAWVGRIAGCMLGKTIEGIKTDELLPILKKSNNYPLHRYISRKDITEEIQNNYSFNFSNKAFGDSIAFMPIDDDTNYTVLYQMLIDRYGKDFTPFDISRLWLNSLRKDSFCTAERVAFCNFVNGYVPPASGSYKNPYREWIGAQIRGDYFGYINPGNPELAAEMAWRDGCISHAKNGIYGEMFVAAMLAVAAETNNTEDILLGGLAQIPHTCRLYSEIMFVYEGYKNGVSQKDCLAGVHKKYDEHNFHDWTHTIPNAMIVAAALLYGDMDYTKSICMAVETGFDTDCNGATVGSIVGMAKGINAIPKEWYYRMNDTLQTSIFDKSFVKMHDLIEKTLEHIGK